MKCACVCMEPDSYPEFFSESIKTARKTYICCECDREILPGEKYEYVFGKWEGDVMTYRTCLGCMRLRDDICNGYVFGGLSEAVWECLGVDIVSGRTIDDED